MEHFSKERTQGPRQIPSAVVLLTKTLSRVFFEAFSHWYLCNHRYKVVWSLKMLWKVQKKPNFLFFYFFFIFFYFFYFYFYFLSLLYLFISHFTVTVIHFSVFGTLKIASLWEKLIYYWMRSVYPWIS